MTLSKVLIGITDAHVSYLASGHVVFWSRFRAASGFVITLMNSTSFWEWDACSVNPIIQCLALILILVAKAPLIYCLPFTSTLQGLDTTVSCWQLVQSYLFYDHVTVNPLQPTQMSQFHCFCLSTRCMGLFSWISKKIHIDKQYIDPGECWLDIVGLLSKFLWT